MRMAVQLLENTGHPGRAADRIARLAQPQQFLALEVGPARHLHDEQVRSQLLDGALGLWDRPHGDGPHARHLVRHAAGQARIAAEEDRGPARPLLKTPRHATNPAARLAVAGRKRSGLPAVSRQGAQTDLEHRQGLSLDRKAPLRLSLAIARHQSCNPITNQRTGEVREPTSSRAPAPSLDSRTIAPAPAPRESIASSGSPSTLPSGV